MPESGHSCPAGHARVGSSKFYVAEALPLRSIVVARSKAPNAKASGDKLGKLHDSQLIEGMLARCTGGQKCPHSVVFTLFVAAKSNNPPKKACTMAATTYFPPLSKFKHPFRHAQRTHHIRMHRSPRRGETRLALHVHTRQKEATGPRRKKEV